MGDVLLHLEVRQFRGQRLDPVGRQRGRDRSFGRVELPTESLPFEDVFRAFAYAHFGDVVGLQFPRFGRPQRQGILGQGLEDVLLDGEDRGVGADAGVILVLAFALFAHLNGLRRFLLVGEGDLDRDGGLGQAIDFVEILSLRSGGEELDGLQMAHFLW